MKASKILSISVAAYNLGEMIRENLESFVHVKGAEKLEILVTNDGSTDNTAEIVKEYEKKYPGIVKLINQKNQGAGSTVNSGIKHATGKYFKMVDGDDWVESKSLEKLLEILEKQDADLILTDYLTYNESKKAITDRAAYNLETKSYSIDEVINQLDIQMYSTMYKTEILQKKKIKVDNGFYTDIEYTLLPLKYAKTLYYFNQPLYVYRVARAGQSMSKSSMIKNAPHHRLMLEHLIEDYQKNKDSMSAEIRKYLVDSIGRVANTELRIVILKEDKVEKVKDFYKWLEDKDTEIYKSFLTGRKAKLLKLTNFKTTSLLKKLVERKFD